ncbi:unnamed protein product [Ilex paraguariensis]|uniref:Uncharacterized protein n=1 Tax=Ilex paraguariensis TaxID=185542 RepID=A0ABC8UW40_9AQUA
MVVTVQVTMAQTLPAMSIALDWVFTFSGKQKSLADKFEYVMHGLLYKISENTEGPDVKVVVYISFGGLQLMLKGNPAKMGKFKVDERNIVHSLKLVESQLDPHLSQSAAVPV